MAITLSSLATNSQAGPQVSRGSGVVPAAQPLQIQKADERVPQLPELTTVQLSSLGKLKSAFADLRTAAAALNDKNQAARDVGIREVAGNFVNVFNSAVQAARSVAAQPGAAVDGGRTRTVEIDLPRSVGADVALAELRRIGIAPQPDGTLAIDSKAFDAALGVDSGAVRDVLSSVGQQVEAAAAATSTDDGTLGSATNAPGARVRSLESEEVDPQALAAARQTVSAQADRLNESLISGAVAYHRVFSL